MPTERTRTERRSGTQTRAEALRIALSLFSSQGYEATSMQQIADQLGIKKGSLYYHFPSKDAVLESLLEGRSDEARELTAWVRAQPASPELARAAVLRWIDSFSVDKLRGIRFMNANPLLVRTIADRIGVDIGDDLAAMQDLLLPEGAGPEGLLLLRMAFMSISSAVAAAHDVAGVSDEQTIAAARAAAIALVDQANRATSCLPSGR
jgi:AcrR family transcriptional regulator